LEFFTFAVVGTFLTALLLGGMAFYSFVMTPLVFAKMERQAAGDFLRTSFAVYYKVMGGISILAALALWQQIEGIALTVIAVLFVLLLIRLLPAINRARTSRQDGDAKAEKRFKFLHRLSVRINMLQLVIAAVVLVRLAAA
jgi:Ca2+/Na+ antiporter